MIFELLVAGAFALATLRRYSPAKAALVASCVVFLSLELISVSGTSAHGVRSGAPNFSKFGKLKPWLHPCGRTANINQTRQPRDVNTMMKTVQTQLKVAQIHFKKNLNEVYDIYSEVQQLEKKNYNLSWLPEKQFEWYLNETRKEKRENSEHALLHDILSYLHDGLQKFSMTFQQLRYYRLHSNANVSKPLLKKRDRLIDKMHNHILRILCEVNYVTDNLELRTTVEHSELIITNNTHWTNNQGDLTRMLIRDWGVIKVYCSFLHDWMRIFNNVNMTRRNYCARHFKPNANNSKKLSGKKGKRMPRMKKRIKPTRKHALMFDRKSSLPQRQRQRKGPARTRHMRRKFLQIKPT